ncbi:uncharacterized protein LTR77_006903 [Saxophila tyrrhenica]|uniref:Uncharacterized protein n=1 Tax=Saxophila tyrrhenica TaxID=1690608 RepID=A0AAV9P6H9_9PEZI|nr:hypothetical protein LTR77_006903 [Saxophila tyrrhenica]
MAAYNVSTASDGTLLYYAPNGLTYAANGDFANCTISVCPVELSVYGYRASLPFSATLIALYTLCAVAQTYLGWRYKTWSFMAAMLLGCFVELLGYVGRIMMWQNPWNDGGFIMQIVLITIGPVFFSAAIYVMLYQIAMYISPSSARFSPKIYYWIFIPCDIVSLILQAAGGALSSTSDGDSGPGVNIAIAGLVFQVVTLATFIAATVDYAWTSRNVAAEKKQALKFKVFAGFFALATILITIRCCYRVYELSEGYSEDSEALRDQPLFIGLEGMMVVLAAWCLVVAHPGPVFRSLEAKMAEKKIGAGSDSEGAIV